MKPRTDLAGPIGMRAIEYIILYAMQPVQLPPAPQNQLFAEHFDHEGIQIMGINWDHPFDWYNANGGVNFSPWWWLFTSEYLVSLLELAGFEVIDVTETWPNKAHAFLCKPKA